MDRVDVLGRSAAALVNVEHIAGQVLEDFLYALACERAGLKESAAQVDRRFLASGQVKSRLLVALVARQTDDHVRVGVSAKVAQPSVNSVERFFVGDIKHTDRSFCASIIHRSHRSKTFLSRSVPDLEANFIIINNDSSLKERSSNSRCRIPRKLTMAVSGR